MLTLTRVELAEANAFVAKVHRHHDPVTGHRFSLGVSEDGVLVGVAICGRPVARKTDQKFVLEVLRLCVSEGRPNACSKLYSAAARIAWLMGFNRVQTFVLESEAGTSLKASGWTRGHSTPGKSWSVPTRKRQSHHPIGPKVCWFMQREGTVSAVDDVSLTEAPHG